MEPAGWERGFALGWEKRGYRNLRRSPGKDLGSSPQAINLAIQLADAGQVDDSYEELKSAGMHLADSPEDRPWGASLFHRL